MQQAGHPDRLGAGDVLAQVVDEHALARLDGEPLAGEQVDLGLRLVQADVARDHGRVEEVDRRAVVDAEPPGVGDQPGLDPGGAGGAHRGDHRLVRAQAGEQPGDQAVGLGNAQHRGETRLELGLVELAGLEAPQERERLGVLAERLPHRLGREALGLAELGEGGPDARRQHAAEVDDEGVVGDTWVMQGSAGHDGGAGYRRDRPRGRRGVVRGERRRRRAPARLRADRGRPLEPHLRGRRRRGQPLGAAAAAAGQDARLGPRHGPRAQGRLGTGADARPGRADRRLLHRRGRQRRPVLRDGVRRRADPAPPQRRRAPSARTSAARSASASSTPWPRSTPSTPTRSASATSARRPTTSRARCTAGAGSGRSRRRARSRWSRTSTSASPPASPSRARRRSSTATTASTT